MRTLPLGFLTFCGFFLLLCVPGKAELFPANHPAFGPNSLTLDTRTGLAWLDLPASADLSYSQVESATAAGGLFHGFRHAKAEEVLSLYNSAGFGEGFIPESSPVFEHVSGLMGLVGLTGEHLAAGITGSMYSGEMVAMAYMNYAAASSVPGYIVTASLGTPGIGTTRYGLDTHAATVGNWLVLVPEPSATALFLATGGLAALLRRRRR